MIKYPWQWVRSVFFVCLGVFSSSFGVFLGLWWFFLLAWCVALLLCVCVVWSLYRFYGDVNFFIFFCIFLLTWLYNYAIF